VSRGQFVTTTVKGGDRQVPDLIDRNFTADKPNLLWVAGITPACRRPRGMKDKAGLQGTCVATIEPQGFDKSC
jgi:hypothetical protein